MKIHFNIDMYEKTGNLIYLVDALTEFKAKYPYQYEKWTHEMIRKIKKNKNKFGETNKIK